MQTDNGQISHRCHEFSYSSYYKASNLEAVKFIIFITMFGSGMSCSNSSKFLRNSDIFQFHIILTFEQINSADSFVFSSSLKKILT